MNDNILYYEAHITIEPVFDERLQLFNSCCRIYDFRAAELIMKKRKLDTPERSTYDTFATGRDKDFNNLKARMEDLVALLKDEDFAVWRFKLEATLLDERTK